MEPYTLIRMRLFVVVVVCRQFVCIFAYEISGEKKGAFILSIMFAQMSFLFNN